MARGLNSQCQAVSSSALVAVASAAHCTISAAQQPRRPCRTAASAVAQASSTANQMALVAHGAWPACSAQAVAPVSSSTACTATNPRGAEGGGGGSMAAAPAPGA